MAQGPYFARRLLPAPILERDIVVHVAVARTGRDRAARRARGPAGAEIAAALVGAKAAAATAARAAIEHGEVRIEPLQHHLGRVFLGAALVGPFARLQLAFDINLGALLQILLGDLAEPFVEDDDAVPLGLFLALAGRLVAPAFGGRDAQIGDRPPVLGPPDLRVLAEVSDQNHLVHAACHRRSPLSKITDPTPNALPWRTPLPAQVPFKMTLYAESLRNAGLARLSTHIATRWRLFQFCSWFLLRQSRVERYLDAPSPQGRDQGVPIPSRFPARNGKRPYISLTSGTRTSSSPVAFGRRYFRLNRVYFGPKLGGWALAM